MKDWNLSMQFRMSAANTGYSTAKQWSSAKSRDWNWHRYMVFLVQFPTNSATEHGQSCHNNHQHAYGHPWSQHSITESQHQKSKNRKCGDKYENEYTISIIREWAKRGSSATRISLAPHQLPPASSLRALGHLAVAASWWVYNRPKPGVFWNLKLAPCHALW